MRGLLLQCYHSAACDIDSGYYAFIGHTPPLNARGVLAAIITSAHKH